MEAYGFVWGREGGLLANAYAVPYAYRDLTDILHWGGEVLFLFKLFCKIINMNDVPYEHYSHSHSLSLSLTFVFPFNSSLMTSN